ncbi:MAG TPA: hypothetical protein VMF32_25080 [Xanthobacteraceae bacterium]|nr:hypothetical protein [Xanthobacteraceae bacterium]
MRRFSDVTPLDFTVILDGERPAAKAWDVATVPTTFLLDAALHQPAVV